MDSRRSFLKKAAMLSGAGGAMAALPASIQRAFAIDPAPGTSYLDAEHIVILMQENRSFDHCFGSLQGVRGFNDPRALQLPSQNPVWLQTNSKGQTFAPFRLNMKESKATWMGSLPHSWTNQVDARNEGKHDGWLEAKRSGHKDYADMPLTLGYYTREDVPFYYALADAFTICDQHFCSSLTGTMPNRLYLWTGTVRGTHDASAPAKVLNEDVEYDGSADWKTFPERLEENGVSWKVYQNELWHDVGFTGEQGPWLSNFGDNPLEWFTQYHVNFAPSRRAHVANLVQTLPEKIAALQARLKASPETDPALKALRADLAKAETSYNAALKEQKLWTQEAFERLPEREQRIHEKAFDTNHRDPHFHELTTLKYQEDGVQRELRFPKGDVLHQFRQDVNSGKLPTVSWIVAPENFSDHPSSAWFGAWYVSEVMDILTRNPEVWKKTIFILTYDENDGYFDHVPPFVAPHPQKPGTGAVSRDIKVEEDYVTMAEERAAKKKQSARESSIGLGFRVPLVIASPWSRGGYVCSQVFDHTSVLQLLERVISHRVGKKVTESNISTWRRAVCGDLTSAFREFHGEPVPVPTPIAKVPFVESIHRAQFKQPPSNFSALSLAEQEHLRQFPHDPRLMARQEPGVRSSCALPYELYADAMLFRDLKNLRLSFAAKTDQFRERSAGSPFLVYAPGNHRNADSELEATQRMERCRHWSFAVTAGSSLIHDWLLADFENERYHLRVHGPNGFFREFQGQIPLPHIVVKCGYQRQGKGLSGNIALELGLPGRYPATDVVVHDHAYAQPDRSIQLTRGKTTSEILDLTASSGWYDFSVLLPAFPSFKWRYAGRVETGRAGITDPAMGNLASR